MHCAVRQVGVAAHRVGQVDDTVIVDVAGIFTEHWIVHELQHDDHRRVGEVVLLIEVAVAAGVFVSVGRGLGVFEGLGVFVAVETAAWAV